MKVVDRERVNVCVVVGRGRGGGTAALLFTMHSIYSFWLVIALACKGP